MQAFTVHHRSPWKPQKTQTRWALFEKMAPKGLRPYQRDLRAKTTLVLCIQVNGVANKICDGAANRPSERLRVWAQQRSAQSSAEAPNLVS
jgi:hypothetical protein